MSFGLELVGSGARWVFETDAVHIHYDSGVRSNALLRRLRHVRVPYEALSAVIFAKTLRGAVLRLRLRHGADPLIQLADGKLGPASHPYRLRVGARQAELAEYHARLLNDRITLSGKASTPAEEFLVLPPASPPMVCGYDGRAVFDGRAVVLRWAWSAASRTKRRAGEQRIPVSAIADVEWLPSRGGPGYLRFRLRDGEPIAPLAQHDPMALVLGYGYGLIADSLPFAAAVLAVAGSEPSLADTLSTSALVPATHREFESTEPDPPPRVPPQSGAPEPSVPASTAPQRVAAESAGRASGDSTADAREGTTFPVAGPEPAGTPALDPAGRTEPHAELIEEPVGPAPERSPARADTPEPSELPVAGIEPDAPAATAGEPVRDDSARPTSQAPETRAAAEPEARTRQEIRPEAHPDPSVANAATVRELYAQREAGRLSEREFQDRKAEIMRRR